MSAFAKCSRCGATVRPRAPACPVCGGLGRCPCGRIADLVRGDNQRLCWRCDDGPRKRRPSATGEP